MTLPRVVGSLGLLDAIADCCARELVGWTVDLSGRTYETVACVVAARLTVLTSGWS